MSPISSRESLNTYHAEIAKYPSRIDEAIFSELKNHETSVFYKPLKNALMHGKRIRPLVLVLSCEAVGHDRVDPYPASVAVELSHLESLIHDDIIDRDKVRRGKTAFHASYGYEMSLLSADFVLSLILGIVSK